MPFFAYYDLQAALGVLATVITVVGIYNRNHYMPVQINRNTVTAAAAAVVEVVQPAASIASSAFFTEPTETVTPIETPTTQPTAESLSDLVHLALRILGTRGVLIVCAALALFFLYISVLVEARINKYLTGEHDSTSGEDAAPDVPPAELVSRLANILKEQQVQYQRLGAQLASLQVKIQKKPDNTDKDASLIAGLSKQIKALTLDVARKDRETTRLAAANAELHRTINSNSNYLLDNSELKKSAAAKDETISKLKSTASHLQANIASITAREAGSNSGFEKKIAGLKEEMEAKDAELQKLAQEKIDLVLKLQPILFLNREIATLKETLESKNAQIEDLKQAVLDQAAELWKEFQAKTDQNNATRAPEQQAKDEKIFELEDTLQARDDKILELQDIINTQDTAGDENATLRTNLERRIDKLEAELNSERRGREEDVAAYKQDDRELEAAEAKRTSEHEEALRSLQDRFDSQNDKVAALEKANKAHATAEASLTSEFERKTSALRNQHGSEQRAKAKENATLKQDIETQNTALIALESDNIREVNKLITARRTWEAEVAALRVANSAKEAKLCSSYEEQIKELKKSKEELNNIVHGTYEAEGELGKEVSRLEAETERLEAERDRLQAENDLLRGRPTDKDDDRLQPGADNTNDDSDGSDDSPGGPHGPGAAQLRTNDEKLVEESASNVHDPTSETAENELQASKPAKEETAASAANSDVGGSKKAAGDDKAGTKPSRTDELKSLIQNAVAPPPPRPQNTSNPYAYGFYPGSNSQPSRRNRGPPPANSTNPWANAGAIVQREDAARMAAAVEHQAAVAEGSVVPSSVTIKEKFILRDGMRRVETTESSITLGQSDLKPASEEGSGQTPVKAPEESIENAPSIAQGKTQAASKETSTDTSDAAAVQLPASPASPASPATPEELSEEAKWIRRVIKGKGRATDTVGVDPNAEENGGGDAKDSKKPDDHDEELKKPDDHDKVSKKPDGHQDSDSDRGNDSGGGKAPTDGGNPPETLGRKKRKRGDRKARRARMKQAELDGTIRDSSPAQASSSAPPPKNLPGASQSKQLVAPPRATTQPAQVAPLVPPPASNTEPAAPVTPAAHPQPSPPRSLTPMNASAQSFQPTAGAAASSIPRPAQTLSSTPGQVQAAASVQSGPRIQQPELNASRWSHPATEAARTRPGFPQPGLNASQYNGPANASRHSNQANASQYGGRANASWHNSQANEFQHGGQANAFRYSSQANAFQHRRQAAEPAPYHPRIPQPGLNSSQHGGQANVPQHRRQATEPVPSRPRIPQPGLNASRHGRQANASPPSVQAAPPVQSGPRVPQPGVNASQWFSEGPIGPVHKPGDPRTKQ